MMKEKQLKDQAAAADKDRVRRLSMDSEGANEAIMEESAGNPAFRTICRRSAKLKRG